MTTKSDSFAYLQNPLGTPNWGGITAAGLKAVNPGAKGSSSATQDNVSAYLASVYGFLADQTSEITISGATSNDWAGAGVRLSTTGGGQGYLAYYVPESPGVSVYKLAAGTVGGGGTYILTIAQAFATGDKLKLGVVGTTLTVYRNGASIGTVSDATYASGQPGIAYQFGNSDGTLITLWTGTDSASGGSASPSRIMLLGAGT